jgi:hypothetical protein
MRKFKTVHPKSPKDFILNHLIPFIKREQGRGFCMTNWYLRTRDRIIISVDGITRLAPACDTVACIGGSAALLLGICDKSSSGPLENIPPKLSGAFGLTTEEAHGLFYHYQGFVSYPYQWPEKYIRAFAAAGTPYRKALVAVKLLRQIAAKGGSILHREDQEG